MYMEKNSTFRQLGRLALFANYKGTQDFWCETPP